MTAHANWCPEASKRGQGLTQVPGEHPATERRHVGPGERGGEEEWGEEGLGPLDPVGHSVSADPGRAEVAEAKACATATAVSKSSQPTSGDQRSGLVP